MIFKLRESIFLKKTNNTPAIYSYSADKYLTYQGVDNVRVFSSRQTALTENG